MDRSFRLTGITVSMEWNGGRKYVLLAAEGRDAQTAPPQLCVLNVRQMAGRSFIDKLSHWLQPVSTFCCCCIDIRPPGPAIKQHATASYIVQNN